MMRLNKGVAISLTGMLLLSSNALIGCSALRPKPTIVMPEARTVKLMPGDKAPYAGWLLTDGAMAKLLEAAERCNKEQ